MVVFGRLTNVPASVYSALTVTISGSVNPDLPGSYVLTYTTTNSLGGVSTITRTVEVFVRPVAFPVAGSTQAAGGVFQLRFTNLSGLLFTVLGSTNVALPLAEWTVLGSPAENPPGTYQFTDPSATNHATHFYRVRSS